MTSPSSTPSPVEPGNPYARVHKLPGAPGYSSGMGLRRPGALELNRLRAWNKPQTERIYIMAGVNKCAGQLATPSASTLSDLAEEARCLRSFSDSAATLAVDVVSVIAGSAPAQLVSDTAKAVRGYDGLYGDIADSIRQTRQYLSTIIDELNRL